MLPRLFAGLRHFTWVAWVAVCLIIGAAAALTRTRARPSRLMQAFSELPPDQQQVISLRFVDHLTASEIARAMGIRDSDVLLLQLQAFRNLLHLLGKRNPP